MKKFSIGGKKKKEIYERKFRNILPSDVNIFIKKKKQFALPSSLPYSLFTILKKKNV